MDSVKSQQQGHVQNKKDTPYPVPCSVGGWEVPCVAVHGHSGGSCVQHWLSTRKSFAAASMGARIMKDCGPVSLGCFVVKQRTSMLLLSLIASGKSSRQIMLQAIPSSNSERLLINHKPVSNSSMSQSQTRVLLLLESSAHHWAIHRFNAVLRLCVGTACLLDTAFLFIPNHKDAKKWRVYLDSWCAAESRAIGSASGRAGWH